MASTRLSRKFRDRVRSKLKSFQDVVAGLRLRDVSEADTVTVVKDMLCEVFGYDKYRELAGEVRVRGAVCDLAVRLGDRTHMLIEVKAANLALDEPHVRQVVNYAAHAGVEWVALTNASEWRVYKVIFDRPIRVEELACFQLADLKPKARHDLERLNLLSREGAAAGALDACWRRHQVVNRFTLAQVIMSPPMLGLVRAEMRRLSPEPVRADDISRLLIDGVLQQEVLEGRRVEEARQRLRAAS